MITNIKNLLCLLLLVAILGSCSKQKGFGPNYSDYSQPAVPVTIQNAVDNRPDPTVTVSLAGDSSITMVLSIPASSGRTIKEITKVATAGSYAAIQSAGPTGFYNVPVVPGTGTTATFKTSIAQYFVNNPVTSKTGTNPPAAANVELALKFYFRVTLDDGSVIYPTPVRVLVLS